MAKLEEILKSKGYSDADIEAMAPMLADQRFRTSLETHFGDLERELDVWKAKDQVWDDWREKTANPAIAAAERTAAEARLEAARFKEEAKIARDYGLVPKDDKPPADPSVSDPSKGTPFNPKDHKLVTEDDLHSAYARFATAEGEAIVRAQDLADEYRYLSGGKSLYEYVGKDGKRGLTALREEALEKKQRVEDYVATKFDFAGLRNAASKKIQDEHDEKIRAEERAKMATQYGNPMLRTPMPSNQPFIPPKHEGGKQPWEIPAQERRNQRLERALKNQMTGPVQ